MNIVNVDDIPKDIHNINIGCQDEVDTAYRLCREMELLCIELGGIGLAAPQVGIPLNLFVVNHRYSQYWINTKYTPVGSSQFWSQEGCLSIPNEIYSVLRHNKIRVQGYLLEKYNDRITSLYQNIFVDVSDLLKLVVIQHESDHCLGKLIKDIGIKVIQ